MARFRGPVGYAMREKIEPGVYDNVITERVYTGSIVRASVDSRDSGDIHDRTVLGNSFSILADAFAINNVSSMVYINWNGVDWEIKSIEINRPRLLVRVGGKYNGILVGDGRPVSDPDKVKDPSGSIDGIGIRSILNEDPLYAPKVFVTANSTAKDVVKAIIRSRDLYRGSGTPILFIKESILTDIMLLEDRFERAIYETEGQLASKLRVREIVPVEVFNDHDTLIAELVNLTDYTVGTNKGGELTSFEDFDIDYNQHKYLLETRLSGALNRPYSAIVFLRNAGTEVTATAPEFVAATNTVTIPTTAGVTYTVDGETKTGSFKITEDVLVSAFAEDDFYLKPGSVTTWSFAFNPEAS